ncbi:hypothetical protein PENSPDRAFT_721564 [Peniophora sp. CONT]|nr:hypothetical protein PENSPDRAFT_721564 [Peniophora sp. CONT]
MNRRTVCIASKSISLGKMNLLNLSVKLAVVVVVCWLFWRYRTKLRGLHFAVWFRIYCSTDEYLLDIGGQAGAHTVLRLKLSANPSEGRLERLSGEDNDALKWPYQDYLVYATPFKFRVYNRTRVGVDDHDTDWSPFHQEDPRELLCGEHAGLADPDAWDKRPPKHACATLFGSRRRPFERTCTTPQDHDKTDLLLIRLGGGLGLRLVFRRRSVVNASRPQHLRDLFNMTGVIWVEGEVRSCGKADDGDARSQVHAVEENGGQKSQIAFCRQKLAT